MNATHPTKHYSPKITQETVAKEAGVDKSTVSIVLARSPRASRISDETRRRIFKAAGKLNYKPNVFASDLRKGRSSFVLLCIPTFRDAKSALLAEAFERRAAERGYRVIISCFDGVENPCPHIDDIIGPHGIASVVMIGRALDLYGEAALHCLLDEEISPVLLAQTHPDPRISQIVVNEREGGRFAATHLHSEGCRNLWVLCDPSQSWDAQEDRLAGVLEQWRILGLPEPRIIHAPLHPLDDSSSAALHAMRATLGKHPCPDGIVALREGLAYEVLRALGETGVSGREVSVTGFDDLPHPGITPEFTTVLQPLEKMGETAADTVIEQVESGRLPGVRYVFDPELLVRGGGNPLPESAVA